MRALCFDHFGGPEVLGVRELPDPVPGPGEVVVRTRAIGLNFADVYRRRGDYHLAGAPPYILGYEAAGEVAAVGEGVDLRIGDRVGFADAPFANAERVRVPAEKLIPLPASISFELAAASLLQGLTAQYLVRDSHRLRSGETVVVHAAAGGVGSLLVQLAVKLGARVCGLTSSPAKAARVRALGAEQSFLYDDGWVGQVRDWTGRRQGADVVYDSVGSTLANSLDASRVGGQVVFFGMAGGNPAPVDPRKLMDTSRTLTGGDLWNVLTSASERRLRAAELFGWLESGALKVDIAARYPLAKGAEAHRFLESRASTGKVLLLPEP